MFDSKKDDGGDRGRKAKGGSNATGGDRDSNVNATKMEEKEGRATITKIVGGKLKKAPICSQEWGHRHNGKDGL